MKIDKAIEILTPASEQPEKGKAFQFQEAIGLGVEALKRIKSNREDWLAYVRLPGED